MNQDKLHKPVMLSEVKDLLRLKDNGNYLDCTFGFGGYSRMILENSTGNLVAIDRDPNVKVYADQLIKEYPNRLKFIQIDFARSISELMGRKFDGIVMDLGVSSMQLDSGDRGFSFTYDGPLDMRMSSEGYSAADFINDADEKEIADIIYQYGDETYSRRIAKKIVEERQLALITNTSRLANIVRGCLGFRKGKIDPATKTFQALRIYVNDELGQLERFLDNCKNLLSPEGRLIIVSFHSLEDRIVKNFFKVNSAKLAARSKYSKKLEQQNNNEWLKVLTKRPLAPSSKEIAANPRSRSAKLRAAESIVKAEDKAC